MPPKPRSYTQLNSWLACGQRYELERISKAPSKPGLWLTAGTAVHRTVERWLRQRLAERDTADG